MTSLDVLNKHMLSIFYPGLEIKLKHTRACSKLAYAYKKKAHKLFNKLPGIFSFYIVEISLKNHFGFLDDVKYK